MRTKLVILALLSALGSGCATSNKTTTKTIVKEHTTLSLFESSMADAAKTSSQAQRMLARVNNAVSANEITSGQAKQSVWQAKHKVSGLQEKISMDWVGDTDGFIRAMKGHLHGWNVVTIGHSPVTAPMLSLFKKNQTIQSILEDVGEQLGGQVDVVVTSDARVHKIEFIYLDEQYDNK